MSLAAVFRWCFHDLALFHNSIKFTREVGFRKISFLNVSVTLTDEGFDIDVFSKPTDAHQYLNYGWWDPIWTGF